MYRSVRQSLLTSWLYRYSNQLTISSSHFSPELNQTGIFLVAWSFKQKLMCRLSNFRCYIVLARVKRMQRQLLTALVSRAEFHRTDHERIHHRGGDDNFMMMELIFIIQNYVNLYCRVQNFIILTIQLFIPVPCPCCVFFIGGGGQTLINMVSNL